MLRRVLRHLALPAMLFLGTMGCVKAQFADPIGSFSSSVSTSGAVVRTYYTELNKFERDVYLDDALYAATEVGTKDANRKPTPLMGQFSAASIKARTDSIALLGAYAERLASLAGSDAPKRFADGSAKLGANLTSLNKTFTDLAQNQDMPDTTAMNYAGPIGQLVGVVGRIVLEGERDQLVKIAISDGAPTVSKILDLLEHDLTIVIIPLQKDELHKKLYNRVTYYNAHRAEPMPARKQMLDEIAKIAAEYDAAMTSNPANLIASMRAAHEALVAYAKSDKSPENLAGLVGALETFKNNVNEAADAVLALKALKEGK